MCTRGFYDMDRYGIKLGVPPFCALGLQAKPDPAATPGSERVLFVLDYPFETVSNTVDCCHGTYGTQVQTESQLLGCST
jgi:hypothetical protein